jgi:acetyl-CoA synthetase
MTPSLEKILVFRHTKNPHVKFAPGRDYLWDAEVVSRFTISI